MKVLWMAAVGCVALVLLGSAEAGDKIDKAKLVGSWEAVKGEGLPPGAVLEFTKDGKVTIVATKGDKTLKVDGTYKVDGNKLKTALSFGGKEREETMTIETLTDTRLITVDEKGIKDEFKRKSK